MTLRYNAVSYTYPGTATGIFDISLDIGAGELLAVVGASGSGKSTLLKLLAGFLKPASGQILVEGRDVSTLPPEARQLGVVVQTYALFPHMRLWENVAYPLKVRGLSKPARRTRAIAMLDRVGMASRADALPASLSGGQQQRVALARALVFEPRGLLLDEPLSALDAGLRVEMREEILTVQREVGLATLLITHDQEEALSIADKVAVMQDGRLLQTGTPRALYDGPASAAIAAFLGQSNLWPAQVVAPGIIETAIGRLACDTAGRPAGDAVTALVRPERIMPQPSDGAGPDQPGVFTGRVVADRFLGPIRRIELAVGGGRLRLETHLHQPVTAVTIPPGAVRLLPAS